MELRLYLHILRRRGWVVLLLVAVVLLVSLAARTMNPPATLYGASMRFSVGVAPEAKVDNAYHYDRYYTFLTSEYLVDDFSEIVKTQAFAQAVSQRLAAEAPPLNVPAGAIQGSAQTGRLHRILTVSLTWSNPDDLLRIANAVVAELQENNARYFAQLGTENADIFLLDAPSVYTIGPGLRERLDLPIRLALALVAGVALAFMWDYLDDAVRGREDVEALGMAVLAEIPRR